jgi:uncharacterized protein YndB with AHSA1/START domain
MDQCKDAIAMSERKIQKSIVLNAETAKVWEALTKPEWTKRYMMGRQVLSDWKEGSPILWKGTSRGEEKILAKGQIEKIEVGKLLQFTSLDLNAEYRDVPANYIHATFELTPKLGKTILSVTEGDYSRVENGDKRFLDAGVGLNLSLNTLKTLIENK